MGRSILHHGQTKDLIAVKQEVTPTRDRTSLESWQTAALIGYVILVALLLLYPFNLFPPNGINSLSPQPGIYFNGSGIAYLEDDLRVLAGDPLKAITIGLWLKERRGSKNWGPRTIVSIQGRGPSPAFTLGLWSGRLFLHSPFATATEPWYEQFLLKERLSRDQEHFVAVSINADGKRVFIDDHFVEGRRHTEEEARQLSSFGLTGRLVLGNSPDGRRGWWGEMKGLAVYSRALGKDELLRSLDRVRQGGVASLAESPDLIALVPFTSHSDSSSGGSEQGKRTLRIPERFSAFPEVLFSLGTLRDQPAALNLRDGFQNIILFIPLGWLLAMRRGKSLEVSTVRLVIGGATIVLMGTLMSFALESLQLLIPTRSASIVDVFYNGLGTAIGVAVFLRKSRN